MSNPIPDKLIDEFIVEIWAYHEENLSDGAWFCMIENQCEEFMRKHKIKGCPNDAAHQLLDLH